MCPSCKTSYYHAQGHVSGKEDPWRCSLLVRERLCLEVINTELCKQTSRCKKWTYVDSIALGFLFRYLFAESPLPVEIKGRQNDCKIVLLFEITNHIVQWTAIGILFMKVSKNKLHNICRSGFLWVHIHKSWNWRTALLCSER